MDDIENKLNSLLSDPHMMEQIMSMAQQLGGSINQPQPAPKEAPPTPDVGFDMASLGKIAGFLSSAKIDQNERALLCALSPYLSGVRISKLEKAMRAAKLAAIASSFLGSGLLSQLNR